MLAREGRAIISPRMFVANLGASLGLAGAASALAFIRGPDLPGGVPDYTLLSDHLAGTLITVGVVFSAIWFSTTIVIARPNGLTIALAVGLAAFVSGVILSVVTFVDGQAVAAPGGGTVIVQVYPQTAYIVVWGVFSLVWAPIAWLVKRRSVRVENPEKGSPG